MMLAAPLTSHHNKGGDAVALAVTLLHSLKSVSGLTRSSENWFPLPAPICDVLLSLRAAWGR